MGGDREDGCESQRSGREGWRGISKVEMSLDHQALKGVCSEYSKDMAITRIEGCD